MTTVTITNLVREDRVSKKSGKPFTSIRIGCDKYGQRWLSGFGDSENAQWKNGDTVEIEVEEKGQYLNFKMPPKPRNTPLAGDQMTRIEAKLDKILEKLGVEAIRGPLAPEPKSEPAVIKPEEDDVPF